MKQLNLLAEYPEMCIAQPHCSYMVKVCRVGEALMAAPKADAPELCVEYWHQNIATREWFDDRKEHLIMLLLNTRYNVEGYSLVSIGSLNESLAHPREVFRAAVAAGSYAIIVMHNHPSGDSSTSQSDHSLTRRLSEAAELLQIKLLDHVVVGRRGDLSHSGYFSFKEAGVL